jgi:hypothetical protein
VSLFQAARTNSATPYSPTKVGLGPPVFLFVLFTAVAFRFLLLLVLMYGSYQPLERLALGDDAIGYRQLALNLVHEGTFRFDRGDATAFRMPGYPVFLAVLAPFSSDWTAVQVVQILIDASTILLIMLLAAALFREAYVPILAGFFLAANPLLIVASVSLLPETFSILLVTSVVFLLISLPERKGTPLAVGALLAAAVYFKPTMLVLAFLLMGAYFLGATLNGQWKQNPLRVAIAPLLVFSALLAPWTARNYLVMHEFIPLTTSSGANLYGGNNPAANGGYASTLPYFLPGVSEKESDAILKERAWVWVRSNPREFLSLLPAKAARFFWPLSMGTSGTVTLPGPAAPLVLTAVLAFYGLCLLGLRSLLQSGRRWEALVMIAVPVGLLVPTLIAFGSARFALPAHPEFAVLAALGLATLARQTRDKAELEQV